MQKSIIRILGTAASCALLLVGCSIQLDDPVLNREPDTGEAIGFSAGSTLLLDDETKASLDAGTTFGVFAFLQPGTVGSPGGWNGNRVPDFMFNVPVYYNGSTYSYSPLKYWPAPQNTLSFWAYCPYTENPDFLQKNTTNAYTNTTGDKPDVRFSVSDGQVDFMTSDILKSKTRQNTNGVVQFTFTHRLSLIDVNVNKQDTESRFNVKLKSVRFDGIYLTGIQRNANWTDLSNNGSFTVFSGNQVLPETPSFESLGGAMLIPQSLAGDEAKLHVEYLICPVSGDDEWPVSANVPLSEVFGNVSFKWEMNKHYTLTITIVPGDPIEFTVEWSDWGTVNNWHITS